MKETTGDSSHCAHSMGVLMHASSRLQQGCRFSLRVSGRPKGTANTRIRYLVPVLSPRLGWGGRCIAEYGALSRQSCTPRIIMHAPMRALASAHATRVSGRIFHTLAILLVTCSGLQRVHTTRQHLRTIDAHHSCFPSSFTTPELGEAAAGRLGSPARAL